jgi:hypothetical protein
MGAIDMSNSPYRLPELRDAQTGELSADAIQKMFGFDLVNFADLSEDGFKYPSSFDEMVHEQGCDLLIRLVQAIVRIIDPSRTKPENEVTQAMHDFMTDSGAGFSRLLRVRQGDAALILEEIYGGVIKFNFSTKRKDDVNIGDWLGFDQSELAAIAKVSGLGLLEAIAASRKEQGWDLGRLKSLYSTRAATMCGSGALRDLFDINYMLNRMGLRDAELSNFGGSETVYRRPANG